MEWFHCFQNFFQKSSYFNLTDIFSSIHCEMNQIFPIFILFSSNVNITHPISLSCGRGSLKTHEQNVVNNKSKSTLHSENCQNSEHHEVAYEQFSL